MLLLNLLLETLITNTHMLITFIISIIIIINLIIKYTRLFSFSVELVVIQQFFLSFSFSDHVMVFTM